MSSSMFLQKKVIPKRGDLRVIHKKAEILCFYFNDILENKMI